MIQTTACGPPKSAVQLTRFEPHYSARRDYRPGTSGSSTLGWRARVASATFEPKLVSAALEQEEYGHKH